MDRNGELGAGLPERPDTRRHDFSEGDAVVFSELPRSDWRAPTRQVVGACTYDLPDGAEPRRYEIAVRKLSQAQGDVDAIIGQVEDPIGEHELHIDIGIRADEFRDHRQEME